MPLISVVSDFCQKRILFQTSSILGQGYFRFVFVFISVDILVRDHDLSERTVSDSGGKYREPVGEGTLGRTPNWNLKR